jgi:heat shock protein HtpX
VPADRGPRSGGDTVHPVQTAAPLDLAAGRMVRALGLFGVLPAVVVSIVVALLVGPLVGLAALVLVVSVWVLIVRARARGAVGRALVLTGATEGAPGEHPRWENVVDGLSLTSGVADPELWYLDTPAANAAALVGGDRTVLVATAGLVDRLSPVELEAIAAGLLGRVRDGSARYGTTATAMLGPFLGRVEGAGRLVAEGLGEQWSVRSDLAAIGITRYPPGLVRALLAMQGAGTEVAGVDPTTAHLWLAPVVTDVSSVDSAVAAVALQPVDLRVAVLQEL